MQKYGAHLVEFDKCCQAHIFLQKFVFLYSRERARQKFTKISNKKIEVQAWGLLYDNCTSVRTVQKVGLDLFRPKTAPLPRSCSVMKIGKQCFAFCCRRNGLFSLLKCVLMHSKTVCRVCWTETLLPNRNHCRERLISSGDGRLPELTRIRCCFPCSESAYCVELCQGRLQVHEACPGLRSARLACPPQSGSKFLELFAEVSLG